MGQVVDFVNVSTEGVESSPVAEALAGLRANEARYSKNKYDHEFTVEAAEGSAEAAAEVERVAKVLKEERDIVVESRPLQVAVANVDGINWVHVFYESGLAVNVFYTVAQGGKRAVGFKLSEGMVPPAELDAFKWARQKSKLAGTVRGSYFVIKGEHPPID